MAVNDEPCETTFESITGMALSETGDAAAVVLVTSTAAADVNAFSQGLFSVAKSGVPGNEHFFNIWDINYDSSGKNLTWAIRLDRQTYGVAVIHWCLADSFFFGIYPTATFFYGMSYLLHLLLFAEPLFLSPSLVLLQEALNISWLYSTTILQML